MVIAKYQPSGEKKMMPPIGRKFSRGKNRIFLIVFMVKPGVHCSASTAAADEEVC